MSAGVWAGGPQLTIPSLFERRLETDPDGEYLDVCATKLTAREVAKAARRLSNAFTQLGIGQGERVATLLENGPQALLAWAGTVLGGRVAVPVNTAYKGQYLRHQLGDSGSRLVVVGADLFDRVRQVADDLPELDHIVVVRTSADDGDSPQDIDTGAGTENADLAIPQNVGRVGVKDWEEVLTSDDSEPKVSIKPSDLGTFIYTGGTTGLSKGCMLSHNYHEALARQIGICWRREPTDVVWTPLPLYHFNAISTVVLGTLVYGGRGAIYRRFSVSNFWPEMNRVGATITSTLGTMAYLLAHDVDRPEMPLSGATEANKTLRLLGAAPMPVEVDDVIKSRFGITTFSGAYG
ncbi:MAG: class I adenylate-forming enzyme family protein, partial [Acidimicrobiales bacterium]